MGQVITVPYANHSDVKRHYTFVLTSPSFLYGLPNVIYEQKHVKWIVFVVFASKY